MQRKLIVFELNEVPFKVIDAYVGRHPNSSIARLMSSAAQFEAHTPDEIHLHPRISWPTFHRGVPDRVHGILQFNRDTSDIDAKYPRYWDLLRRRGKTIGIGASIGSFPPPSDRENISFYLPDMFAPAPDALPSYLSAFQAFNLRMLSKSSRVVSKGTDASKALSLLANAPRIGIRSRTLLAVAKQLAAERVNEARIVRRRTFQGMLTFDVVFHQIERTKPDLATFFTNHVASSMHRYWAAAFPDDYANAKCPDPTASHLEKEVTENAMPPEWIETYKDEIDFCMGECDKMLARLLAFLDKNAGFRLLLITSMGQKAAVAKPRANEVVLASMDRFLAGLGFDESEWTKLPGMHPTYNARFVDGARYQRFRDRMQQVRIAGKGVSIEENGPHTVAISIRLGDVNEKEAVVSVGGETRPFDEFGLSLTRIQDGVGTSGWHTPDGVALIYDPATQLSSFHQRERIDTTAFTAAILKSFAVPVPSYMPQVPEALTRCLN